jgi:hypothetical protein
VRVGERFVGETYKLTILPPFNDIRALTEQGSDVELLATTDFTGRRMWIPFSFGGFGIGDPMCSTLLTPITAFAVDFTLRRGEDELMPHLTFTDLKKTKLFLGDYEVWDKNLYGMKFASLKNIRHLRNGAGLAICTLNDTMDLVMMVRLQQAARGPNSEIMPIVRDGSPFTVKLRNISADPAVSAELSSITTDAFSSPCPAP